MSTDLYESPSLAVTRFYGGAERGTCIQIGTRTGYVQLTLADAAKLADVLRDVTAGVDAPRGGE
jgi:hypothetical protein